MLEVRELGLTSVKEIVTRRFADDRGWFTETWNKSRWETAGLAFDWVQDNHAWSEQAGTVRALHFQRPPFAQTKLVRALTGSVFDVAVDIRRGSPTFGHWVGITLSAAAGNQILVPQGFAHGYMTLEPGSEVAYKVDAPYAKDSEGGIRWDDAAIGITWPDLPPVLNDKDRDAPTLADADTGFATL